MDSDSFLLVERPERKPTVLHPAKLLDDGLGQLAVCSPVVVDLHEHEVKLAVQVVLVVPPLFEVLRENEVLLLDNLAQESYPARPTSFLGPRQSQLGDVLAYVIEVFVLVAVKGIHQPVLARHERDPLRVVLLLCPFRRCELVSVLSDRHDLLLHFVVLSHILFQGIVLFLCFC